MATNFTELPKALNVGTGRGFSVKEVIELIGDVASLNDVSAIQSERRSGDPATLYADVALIRETIEFVSNKSIEESIKSLFFETS
jgi:UDP-glucose 4-epimerase